MTTELVSIATTMEALGGVSRSTVTREIREGKLEAVKIRGRTGVTVKSIKRRIAEAPRVGGSDMISRVADPAPDSLRPGVGGDAVDRPSMIGGIAIIPGESEAVISSDGETGS